MTDRPTDPADLGQEGLSGRDSRRSWGTGDLMVARGLRGIMALWGPLGGIVTVLVSGAAGLKTLESKIETLERKVDKIQGVDVLGSRVAALEQSMGGELRLVPVTLGVLQRDVQALERRLESCESRVGRSRR